MRRPPEYLDRLVDDLSYWFAPILALAAMALFTFLVLFGAGAALIWAAT
jgi:hypothetical protein